MLVKLTQQPKRASNQLARQKDFIKWMLHVVKNIHNTVPNLLEASNRIL